MCGIAGLVGGAIAPGEIERMTERLRHRGPDRMGIWRGEGVELGHTRLAIVDLSSAGDQPMRLGPLTLTYNGEIYNFRKLRESLVGPFESDCDTEVLLHLLAADPERALAQLQGMFAFAVWDERRNRLFAARDRMGIKPFYYREFDGGLAFASEVKALLELGRPPIDPAAMRDYFTYKYVPDPGSIYRGIRQLPPGHWLSWDGNLQVERYWRPGTREPIRDPDEAVEELGELLARIVPAHTMADVPVAVFLSGGIDSATVAGHLERPRTFTLGTDIRRRDEAPHARQIAEHFGTEHREGVAKAVNLDEALNTIPEVFDEPFGDSGAWSNYLVSGMAREHAIVALSGEGGDELFAGYQWYSKWPSQKPGAARRLLARTLPAFSGGGRSAQRRSLTGLARYAAFLGPFTEQQRQALLGPRLEVEGHDDLWHFRRHWREELTPIKRMQWIDLHTFLPGDLLTKVDRASMAHSLEVRPPLLDHELVEFALALEPELMHDARTGKGKLLVRRLMEPRIPEGYFDRPKRGFNLPIRSWAQKNGRLMAGALDRLADMRIIRRPRMARFTNEQTWSLLSLDAWLRQSGASW